VAWDGSSGRWPELVDGEPTRRPVGEAPCGWRYRGPVRHKRFPIDHLAVAGRPVSVRYCDLLVAVSPETSTADWECLAASNDEVQLDQGAYELVLRSGTRLFDGEAILVRSDGLSHVFRGIGPLNGVADAELT
jgi:hypothetical protein